MNQESTATTTIHAVEISIQPHTERPVVLGMPDCLIIGAMKAGTTTLYDLLRTSPQINACRVKEPNYFTDPDFFGGNWGKGIGWYSDLFDTRSGIKMEASTNYSKMKQNGTVIKRIYDTLPHVRFVYLVREPVARAISHYLHHVIRGYEDLDIVRALVEREDSIYHHASMYHAQLMQYTEVFPLSSFCVLTSEAFWNAPRATAHRVLTFLGADASNSGIVDVSPQNTTKSKIVSLLSRGNLTRAQDTLLAALYPDELDVQMDAVSIGRRLGVNSKQLRRLSSIFLADANKLRKIINDPLSEWKSDY